MALIRRARGHYVERFNGATMAEREAAAQRLWDGHAMPCQRHLIFKSANWCFRMTDWCQNCASDEHQTRRCPHKMDHCPIEHYRGIDHSPHSIITCPQLHSFCHVCKIRGHLEQLHPDLEQTPRELRADYMQHCHRGVYTSLPYLYEPNGPVNNHHWHATISGQRFLRGQADLWQYRGLRYSIPAEFLEARKRREKTVEENVDSTVETYQKIPE